MVNEKAEENSDTDSIITEESDDEFAILGNAEFDRRATMHINQSSVFTSLLQQQIASRKEKRGDFDKDECEQFDESQVEEKNHIFEDGSIYSG